MPLTVTPNRRHRGHRSQSSSSSMNSTRLENDIPSATGAFSRMAVPMPILTGTSTQMSKDVPIAPKTITPLNFRSSTPSWEDYDEGVFGAVHKSRRNKEYGVSPSPNESYAYPVDSSYEDEEMPMDELMDSSMKPSTPVTQNVRPSAALTMPNPPVRTSVSKITAALENNSMERPEGLSLEERMLWDAVKSTVFNASKRSKADPSAAELERKLSKSEARVDKLNQKLLLANTENTSASSESSVRRINQLEEQVRAAQSELKKRESEHDSEVRAIQRVLAEMSTEREEETQVLNDTVATLSKKVETLEREKQAWHNKSNPPPPPPSLPPKSSASFDGSKDASSDMLMNQVQQLKTTIKDLEAEKIVTQKDLDRKARHAMVLERDYKVLKVQLKKAENGKKQTESGQPSPQVQALKAELEKVKERNQKLTLELDVANKERKARRKAVGSMTPPRPDITNHSDVDSVASSMSAEDVESMHKNLSETTSSLENAKKIIASLENANGSMAVDLRAKLKAKEDELTAIQKESAERKRRLDTLATELRDLQKKQDDVDKLNSQSKTQVVRHKALMGLLEQSVSGLQAASAVHEVTTATGQPDPANVEQISDILNDAMIGIRTSLEMSEQYIEEFDDDATAFTDVDVSSEVGRQIDAIIKNDREALAKNLQNELEQKKIAVRRLEEALKKQNEEIKRLRVEQRSSGDNQQLLAEIKSLREQCSSNMEVLSKKERELSVLRSSLKLDDNASGYISDDASDGEDENDTTVSSSSPRLSVYGPEQTEALATLLAAGGSMPDHEPKLKKELLKSVAEKERAVKELKAERESLANAKLIISSLEKANKSMMEDLRSRLQDSNTAISSLLDKSLEQEKNSDTLQKEVEKLKKEKEALESKIQKHAPAFEEEDAVVLSDEKKDSL
jgi:DNA repair exonuclease SbcCD ATPase subunit